MFADNDFCDDSQFLQVTVLVAADGALKFPEIKRPADLVAVLEKLNSIPTREIRVYGSSFLLFHNSKKLPDVISSDIADN